MKPYSFFGCLPAGGWPEKGKEKRKPKPLPTRPKEGRKNLPKADRRFEGRVLGFIGKGDMKGN